MYTAVELSKYIVTKCVNDNSPVTNIQLQNILYIIQKDFAANDIIIIADDFEAWAFGPVAPNAYYHFCGYGTMPITVKYDLTIEIKPSDKTKIDAIVESKRQLSPWDMMSDTQSSDGAWAKIYENGCGNKKSIPIELIETESQYA